MDFFNTDCKNLKVTETNGEFEVIGKLNDKISSDKIMFLAPNPSDHLTSYSGSGLPFPNSEVAFENTPNKGVTTITADGSFKFKIHYPNSYYSELGTNLIKPHVFIKLCNSKKIHSIKLNNFIPFRFLDSKYKYKYGQKNEFENEIMTQEKLLRKNGI